MPPKTISTIKVEKPIKDTKCFFCDTLTTKRGINIHITKFHHKELDYNRKNNLPLPLGFS
jgi:hypothetical protein